MSTRRDVHRWFVLAALAGCAPRGPVPDDAPAPVDELAREAGDDARGEDTAAAPDIATTPGMVAVPAGPFLMGCNAARDRHCAPDEFPLHMVSVSAFEIDRTEVTQEAYARCVAAGACTEPMLPNAPGPMHPVVGVDDAQAAAYCAWRGARLPTEAEWEKAARGADGRVYPWGFDQPTCARANSVGCTGAPDDVGTHPTGASPYGVQDMAGNVEEWVADWYDPTYYARAPGTDPQGAACGPHRVRRGGTYLYAVDFLRCSQRGDMDPPGPTISLGFRCARSLGPRPDAGESDGGGDDATCVVDAGTPADASPDAGG